MTDHPKVSVIMGVYNCAQTLPEAIESILKQTYDNWELIICDDASEDDTCAVAERYQKQYPEKIALLRNDANRKLSYTLNRCLEVATGELVARMDGDDRSHPDRFRREVDYLMAHPDVQLVGTDMQCFDEKGKHRIRHAVSSPEPVILRNRSPFFHATIMTYRSVYDALHGYTVAPRTERAEDLDLWFRFFQIGYAGANIPETLYEVREDQETFRRRTVQGRINGLKTLAWGYRLLGFPARWMVKPVILAGLKSVVPAQAVRWMRQRQDFLNGGD